MALLPAAPATQPVVIFLGGIGFANYEVPETVRYTPTQNSVIHKFIGGARTIDVLGQDDDVIKWSGTFLGPDAEARAKLLTAYVYAGEPQYLTFGGIGYEVVVKQAAIDYRGAHLIDFAIECYVLQNGAAEGAFGVGATQPGQNIANAGNIPPAGG